jgi:hypothetical protein
MYEDSILIPGSRNIPDSEGIQNVKDSLSQLNMHQILSLDNVFKETKFQEVYKFSENKSAGSSSQYVIKEPGLLGFTRTRDLMLQVPVRFTVGSKVEAIKPIVQEESVHPDFGLLGIFSRIECFLGNNRQPIGRYTDTTILGIKRCAASKKVSKESAAFYGMWGPSYSKTYVHKMETGQRLVNDFDIPTNLDISLAHRQFLTYLLHGFVNSLVPNLTTYTIDATICLPMYMINGFFSVESFLPPNIPLELILHYYNDPLWIYANTGHDCKILANLNGAPRLVYAYSTLNDEYRNQIASLRSDRRLLYNYETWEDIDISIADFQSKNSITATLSLSQVCPTQICLNFYTKEETYNAKDQKVTFKNSLSHMSRQIPEDIYAITAVPNSIAELNIEMEGRLIFRYLNQEADADGSIVFYKTHEYFPNAYDVLFTQMDERSYRSQGTFSETNTQQSGARNFNCPFSNSRLFINLTPNAIADTGVVNANLMARTIKIFIRFRGDLLLNSGENLSIAKRIPTQMVINSLNETFNYSWPHLATDKNSYIISTVNAQ